MTVNLTRINIFDPEYAFAKASKNPESPEYPALHFLSRVYRAPENVKRFYADGDTIPLSSEYFDYPENMAVVINSSSLFRIQFFRDGKVGNFYADIHADKELIRAEFEACDETLMVMENSGYSRVITNNFEDFYEYLCLLDNARNEFTVEQTPFFHDYYAELTELQKNRDKYVDADITTHYRRILRLGKSCLKEIEHIAEIFNKVSSEKMNNFFLGIPDYQRTDIFFGLFLFMLRHGISQNYFNSDSTLSVEFTNMLYEFSSFLQDNPDIIVDYALRKNLSEEEKEEIAELLSRENLLSNKPRMFATKGILD